MVKYEDLDISEIELIKDMWYKNLEYHYDTEKYFKEQYSKLSFEDRMSAILQEGNQVKITIAKEDTILSGYCISKIVNGFGEIVSLHVLEEKRKQGIGKRLIYLHLDWLKINNCNKIGLYVASVNTETISFYESLGLRANLTYMEIPDKSI